MAILPDAQNVLIQKSQFGTDQTIQIQNNISAGSSGIDVLLQASFPEATHDSNIRHPPPRCFPETRTQYIEDITQWVASPVERDPLPMYWMKGPAGVGKTAVAQTCAEKFKELNLLGAAFFFSVNGRADHTHFFPSVAYQLCTELSDFRQLLDNKISRDKTIVGKAMVWQFKNLFSESIQELQRMGKSVPRKAIIIDGLDECLSKEAQCEIIEIIAGSARESSTPFYWAFFSRPEMHIETTFAKNDIAPHCQLTILPISRTADKDIELYLRSGFANILLRRNLSVSSPWPSERDMKALIEACAGLFIYAATLLRYVDRPVAQGPIEQLNAVLASLGGASGTDGSPFAELDAFYTLILRRIPTEIFPSVRVLLGGMFLYSFHPTLFWSAVQLSNQLRLSEIQFKILCSELRAVLCFYDHDGPYDYGQSITTMSSLRHASFTDFAQIQQKARMLGGVITLHHKSFWDFLHDPARSGIYCISTQEMYNLLFSHYLQVWGDCQRCFSLQAPDSEPLELSSEPPVPLTWPQTDALVSAYNYSRLFNMTGVMLGTLCFRYAPDPALVRALARLDHRKHILCQVLALPDGFPIVVHGLTYDCDIMVRRAGNVLIRCIQPSGFHKFNIENFLRMIKIWRQHGLIRPYYPTFISRIKSIFQQRGKRSSGQSVTGLYRMGRSTGSVLWYWSIDVEHRYLREYWTTDLAEGARLYSEQDFDSWEAAAHRASGFQESEGNTGDRKVEGEDPGRTENVENESS